MVVGEENTPDIERSEEQPPLDLVDLDLVPDNLRAVDIERVSVYLDPLDATKEFTQGVLHCVITLIGICVDSKPVAGVMNQAFGGTQGNTVYGMPGINVQGLAAGERARLPEHTDKVWMDCFHPKS